MAHQLPPFPQSVRFATPADIERLAVIAFAGGLQTDEFNYESPYAHKYPEDTLESWRFMLAETLRSKQHTLIVAEDIANPDEDELTPAAVPVRYRTLGVGRCIVGFARLRTKPNYPKEEVFQKLQVLDWLSIGKQRHRHVDQSSEYSIRVACESLKRLADTQLSLETLIVHPAYHRRGHGKRLVNWMLDLAKLDSAVVGVVATRLGVPLYRSLNFKPVYGFSVAPSVSVQLMRFEAGSGTKSHDEDGNVQVSAMDSRSDPDLSEICEDLTKLTL